MVLLGSFARSDYGLHSDLDLVVIVDRTDKSPLLVFIKDLQPLSPRSLLAVIDLSQKQDLPLRHMARTHPTVTRRGFSQREEWFFSD